MFLLRRSLDSCKAASGCTCIDGYVREGNSCIPKQDCGCVINGRYVIKSKCDKLQKIYVSKLMSLDDRYVFNDLHEVCECQATNTSVCTCLVGFERNANGVCESTFHTRK